MTPELNAEGQALADALYGQLIDMIQRAIKRNVYEELKSTIFAGLWILMIHILLIRSYLSSGRNGWASTWTALASFWAIDLAMDLWRLYRMAPV